MELEDLYNITIEWSEADQIFIARLSELGLAAQGKTEADARVELTDAVWKLYETQVLDDDISRLESWDGPKNYREE